MISYSELRVTPEEYACTTNQVHTRSRVLNLAVTNYMYLSTTIIENII